eukprot:3671600-Lingulodinium_polyedra.AAC.1
MVQHGATRAVCDAVERVCDDDAVELIICHRNDSSTARAAHIMQTPKAGVRMVCATRAVCEPPQRQM